MAIKFLGLDRCFKQHQDALTSIYCDVGLSGHVVGGKHVADFENNCAEIADRKYAISTANASDGLFFTLSSLGITTNDEVLTTAYSFHATAESILRTNATPVFVDVTDDYLLDLSHAEKLITNNTKAIIIVNLFGNCFNFKKVQDFAKKHNILVIEDAAQSFMSSWNNIPSGKLGIASVYSFAPSKNVPGFSHGGCVLTDDENLYKHILAQKLHGKQYNKHTMVGYNSIISSFEAAQLNFFFTLKEEWQQRREYIAKRYVNGLINLVKLPHTNNNVKHCWHKFVINTIDRDELAKFLRINNIEYGIHYNTISPNELIFNNSLTYTNASKLSNTCLSLPMYPELENYEVDYIIKTIQKFFTKS